MTTLPTPALTGRTAPRENLLARQWQREELLLTAAASAEAFSDTAWAVPALVAEADVPVHLLVLDESLVQWSFDEALLRETAQARRAQGALLAYPEPMTLCLPTSLAQRLAALVCPSAPMTALPAAVHASLAAEQTRQAARLARAPDWLREEGLRIYVAFLSNGECRWSPSGNNLHSMARHAPPDTFVFPAVRLNVSVPEYVALMAQFEWACDNF